MTWIDGAKILADRIGQPPAKEPVQVEADAPALFHWCNMNPVTPVGAGADDVVSD
jgi:hypothetical protein